MLVQPLTGGGFRFKCHKGLSCFTACCGNLNLILTPYDIIRLKTRLGLSSKDFLKKYTKNSLDKSYGFPVVSLKMMNNKKQSCPFVSPGGCTIYEDRPGACRIYPLGRAASKVDERKKSADFFFIIKEPHCLGFNETKKWRVQDWVQDQGLDEYNKMNDFFMDIVTGKNFRRIKGLSSKQLQMFYMSCYDLDEFKDFIFKSTFMNRFEIDPDEIHRIRTNDVELMKFGVRWLNFALFGEKTLSVKPYPESPADTLTSTN